MISYAEAAKKNLSKQSGVLPKESKDTTIQKKTIKKTVRPNHEPACFIDVGVNLTHKDLNKKVERILTESVKHGCTRIIVIGNSVVNSERALQMVKKYNALGKENGWRLYCTVGVHPHGASKVSPDWYEKLDKLIQSNKGDIVAIGECGLDFDRMFSKTEDQKDIFTKQLELAEKYSLPVYLHERKAHEVFISIIKDRKPKSGIVHCFTGDKATAEEYITNGLDIGITGWICDGNRNMDLLSALPYIPLDRMHFETDAPYLTPKNLLKKPFHNSPQYVPHIVKTVSKELAVPVSVLAKHAKENAKRLFAIE